MTREVLEYLAVDRGTYIDMTVGGGTHTQMILRELKSGSVIGIDLDPDALDYARARLADYLLPDMESRTGNHPHPSPLPFKGEGEDGDHRLQMAELTLCLIHGNFGDLEQLVSELPEVQHGVAGIVADLGLSRHEAVTPERGFSYQANGPLDMRFDATSEIPTARALIMRGPEREIARILHEYGEEPFARRIGRRIWEQRQSLHTTTDLAGVVRSAVPYRFQHKAVARVFQAFRIAVNNELENLRRGVDAAIRLLAPGSRIVIVSYHSLEDRIVKQAFRASAAQGVLEILTRKPLRPGDEEVAQNPSARSARLRAAEKKTGTYPQISQISQISGSRGLERKQESVRSGAVGGRMNWRAA